MAHRVDQDRTRCGTRGRTIGTHGNYALYGYQIELDLECVEDNRLSILQEGWNNLLTVQRGRCNSQEKERGKRERVRKIAKKGRERLREKDNKRKR